MDNDLRKLRLSDYQKACLQSRLNILKMLSEKDITPDIENKLVNNFIQMLGFFPNMGIKVYFQQPFERLVINRMVRKDKLNRRLYDFSQIKYPPKNVEENLNYNRASMKGQSVFYAGFGSLSTALETEPKYGDLYTVSKWKQKEGTKLIHFPIYYNEEIGNRPEYNKDWIDYRKFLTTLNPNLAEYLENLLRFITDVFTKPIPKDKKVNYIFTSLIANYYLTNPESDIQCLYYPSVPSNFVSSNLACMPKIADEYFECVEVRENICTMHNGSRWLSHRIAEATDINPNAEGPIK